jgi:hypothetical protein
LSWIPPVALVLLVGLAMAAAHWLFARWMQRSSEPAPAPEHDEEAD